MYTLSTAEAENSLQGSTTCVPSMARKFIQKVVMDKDINKEYRLTSNFKTIHGSVQRMVFIGIYL
jgi:hypothetical protein